MTFLLLVPILLWAFFTWDGLIKLEHKNFYQQWINDGQPIGMYWRPSKLLPSFHSGMATQKYMLIWLFKNPPWVESSDEALKLLRRYRILVLAWNISIVLWFFVVLRFFG